MLVAAWRRAAKSWRWSVAPLWALRAVWWAKTRGWALLRAARLKLLGTTVVTARGESRWASELLLRHTAFHPAGVSASIHGTGVRAALRVSLRSAVVISMRRAGTGRRRAFGLAALLIWALAMRVRLVAVGS